MFCTGCGTALADNTRFCNSCGAEVTGTHSVSVVAENFGAGKFGADKPPPSPPPPPPGKAREAGIGASGRPGNRAETFVGRTLDAKYRLDEIIGAGGMGTVYRATRLMIGDTVAIKIMHSEFVSDDEAERFRREAQAAARLKHHNAVQIYDFGVSADGLLYLVMELVEGESLRAIIKAQGALAPRVAVEITQQVCAALDEAHAAHIVHRDVKPDNVVVARTARGLRVKLLDFGVAKMRDVATNNLTQTGSIVGTPHYMSPEQCLGEELDGRSDIYSLGVVLYEMLAGVVPFNSPISTAVIVQHVNQPPPPLSDRQAGINAATEHAVRRALEKKREARPQTAGALADELVESLGANALNDAHAHAGVAPVVAAPTTNAYGASFGPDSAGDLTVVKDGEADARTSAGARERSSERSSAQTVVLAAAAAAPVANASSRTGANTGGGLRRAAIGMAAIIVLALGVVVTVALLSRGQSDTTNDSSAPKKDGRRESAATAPTLPEGMLRVPGGEFVMGDDMSGDDYERPAHRVRVAPFLIDKYEVTCEEYAGFMRAQNYTRAPQGWSGADYAPDAARHPVTGITWDDANAYAEWAGKRLPTEEEWEFAARGTDGRRYPWGDEWRAGLANADAEGQTRKQTSEVGRFAGGASPFGVFDMAGNVWEWTSSPLAAYPGGRLPSPPPGDNRVIRGGSWDGARKWTTTTYRGYLARTETKPTIGFRCARDAD